MSPPDRISSTTKYCWSSSMLPRVCGFLLLTSSTECFTMTSPRRWAFVSTSRCQHPTPARQSPSLNMMYAPPGSGYARPEDEESAFPDTYEPMMEYPGTMRPGRTPENMPFQDLPIADDDPDPVPWPHFQQIEWHHKWAPPHPHPIPMEEFIEMHGRWATPEMEAAMRAGVRQGARERQEQEETERRESWIITDDDEDGESDEPISLGEGMFGQLGSAADEALTAEAVTPKPDGEDEEDDGDEEDDSSMEDDLDSFLLDLGLDADVEMDDIDSDADGGRKASSTQPAPDDMDLPAADDDDGSTTLDLLSDSGDVTATINVDADDDLDLGLDEDDDITGDDGVSTVPLDDFGDDNDSLDGEDIFDDGGFDYDDGDFDGGDVW